MVQNRATAHSHSGQARWGWRAGWRNCRRQRHKAHTASSQAGQLNHISMRAVLCQSLPCCQGLIRR